MTSNRLKSLTLNPDKPQQDGSLWYLYIIETRLGHWYTGISTDVTKRFAAHQAGKGAKNLKGKGPLILIHQQAVGTRSEATKLEIQVKKLSKMQKRRFVASAL